MSVDELYKLTNIGTWFLTQMKELVDFEESRKALEEIKYDGWIVLETPPGPPELVARDVSFTLRNTPGLKRRSEWPLIATFTFQYQRGEWDKMIEEFKASGIGGVHFFGGLLEEALEDPDRIPEYCGKIEEN